MAVPGSWRGIVNIYNKCPKEVRDYFAHLPSLAENYPWDVCISYMFSLVEMAQNNILYCGMVKLHKVNGQLARIAVDGHPLYRDDFKKFYKAIFDRKPKQATFAKFEEAAEIRDKILHGKKVSEKDKRKAVVDILKLSELLNNDISQLAGFKPFGNLRGYKGAGKPLDKSTSRWVLKGIGFNNI